MAKWQHNPISAKAGAPAAAGKPTGFAWEHDKTQHIVYRGADSQIHELWFRHGLINADWKYGGALSAITGAPPPPAIPVLLPGNGIRPSTSSIAARTAKFTKSGSRKT